jgi:hypothetical protein
VFPERPLTTTSKIMGCTRPTSQQVGDLSDPDRLTREEPLDPQTLNNPEKPARRDCQANGVSTVVGFTVGLR